MKNLRDTATAEGRPTYSSGKPCRAGHTCDRYTSNGMCIECTKQQTIARRDSFAIARGRKFLAMAAGYMPHSVLSSQRDRETFDQLSEIFRVANVDQVAHIHQYIKSMYLATPTPRSLSREDLLAFMDYNGEVVTNYETLELDDTDDEVLYLIHNGQRYNAVTCMDVLRRKVLNVKPEPPKDTRPAWKPT